MKNVIYMSIKEQHINTILDKSKNHEFRTKIPKDRVNYIIVYVPTPIRKLKYILKVKNPIVTPNKIEIDGIGNQKFNSETKKKYAYPVINVYELNKSIDLQELKSKFNFTAPQSFAYGEKYKELLDYIDKIGVTKLY